jgi:hypothetical protein
MNTHMLHLVATGAAVNWTHSVLSTKENLLYVALTVMSITMLTAQCSIYTRIGSVVFVSAVMYTVDYSVTEKTLIILIVAAAVSISIVGLYVQFYKHRIHIRGEHWMVALVRLRGTRFCKINVLEFVCKVVESTQSITFVSMWVALKVAGLPHSLCHFDVYEVVPIILAIGVCRMSSSAWDIGAVSVCVWLSAALTSDATPLWLFVVLVTGHCIVLIVAGVYQWMQTRSNNQIQKKNQKLSSTQQQQQQQQQQQHGITLIARRSSHGQTTMVDIQERQRQLIRSWAQSTRARVSCISLRLRVGRRTLDMLCGFSIATIASHLVVFTISGAGAGFVSPLSTYIQQRCTQTVMIPVTSDPDLPWYWALCLAVDFIIASALHPGVSGTHILMNMENATPVVAMVIVPIISYHLLVQLM